MYFYYSTSKDPYFNLALEEYCFNDNKKDYFILYRNGPSVIIGKHQNPYLESNLPYLGKNNIKLVRRISGGGTVYHDENNINFSFILNSKEGKQIDFKKYTEPIFNYLLSIGLNVEYSKRNDILLEGFKISGNAEHVIKNRVLHHGTLLFDSNIEKLNNSLNSKIRTIDTKAVKSVRSKVNNITNYLKTDTSINQFINELTGSIKNNTIIDDLLLIEKDLSKINAISEKKYQTWEWNFAYTPNFIITIKDSIIISVSKGIITNLQNNENKLISKKLVGTRFRIDDIIKSLEKDFSLDEINSIFNEVF